LFFHPKGVTEHEIELRSICRRNEGASRCVVVVDQISKENSDLSSKKREFCGIEESESLTIETTLFT